MKISVNEMTADSVRFDDPNVDYSDVRRCVGSGYVVIDELVQQLKDYTGKVKVMVTDPDKLERGWAYIAIEDIPLWIRLPKAVVSNYDDAPCLAYGLFEYVDETYKEFKTQPDRAGNRAERIMLFFEDFGIKVAGLSTHLGCE